MPPLVGVAVNVTLIPIQIAPEGLADMLTLAGNAEFTDITTKLDVAGEPVAHVALDIIIHLILSLFTRAALV